MGANDLRGELVRLAVPDLDADLPVMLQWDRDSEFQRLLDCGPSSLWPLKTARTFWENELKDIYFFLIRTVADDRAIGLMDLEVDARVGDGWVGIGIGERAYWGKGYGSEAMRLLVRYAFMELNLRRVSLNVFEYNQRAIRSYEKVGFRHEGRERRWMQRSGRRWDLVYMGLLRSEWEESQTRG